VHRAVILGLSATLEDFLQEGGRCMRGGPEETQGQRGIAFFIHKGALGIFLRKSRYFMFSLFSNLNEVFPRKQSFPPKFAGLSKYPYRPFFN
jgi:hypothetical protein